MTLHTRRYGAIGSQISSATATPFVIPLAQYQRPPGRS